jgi:hypothetical protein
MITFTLTEQQADLILAALQQRPHFEVNGLINVLLQQASEQQKQAQQQAKLQEQTQRVIDRSFDAAESNRIGVSTDAGQQAANGLDHASN